MKKILKITLISLGSLLGLLLLAVCVLLYAVLTPSRMTPIVDKVADRFVDCQSYWGKVDVTFFSTFPNIAVHVEDVCLVNPMERVSSDTLARVDEVVAAINVRRFLKENVLEVKTAELKGGEAHLFVREDGCMNFDVFRTDTSQDSSSVFPLEWLSAEKVLVEHLHLCYTDETSHRQVEVEDLSTRAKLGMSGDELDANVRLNMDGLSFQQEDSTSLRAELKNVELHVKGSRDGSDIAGNLQLNLPWVQLEADSTLWVDSSHIRLDIPLTYNLDSALLRLNGAAVGVDGVVMDLKGNVRIADTAYSVFDCDLAYAVHTVEVPELFPWVEKFSPGLLDGMELDGFLSLGGTVQGRYSDSLMPEITANLLFKQGELVYEELYPDAIRKIVLEANADIDLNDESASKVDVKAFSVEAGKSKVHLSGMITDIFDRINCDVLLTGDVQLPDVKCFLPEDMPMELKGSVSPSIRASFDLEDLQNVNLQKINAKGTLDVQKLQVDYDSIHLDTKAAALKVQLPSPVNNKNFKELLQAKIQTEGLNLHMESGPTAEVGHTDLIVGVSDVMDTTRLLSVDCDFDLASVHAVSDTVSLMLDHPQGNVVMTPSPKDLYSPAFSCDIRSNGLAVSLGNFLKTVTRMLSISGNVVYDSTQTQILDQWSPNLNISLQEGNVEMDGLKDEVRIPSIRFRLNPECLDIKNGTLGLGQSEFTLSGLVTNLASYMKDEGLLKADLQFVSDYVDVNYLMDFISGMNIGNDTVEVVDETVPEEDDPFMVPLGMDVVLHTHAKELLVGQTLIDDLDGKVTIRDGVLVMEEMGFTCDAARMQLTAMYKSPRKNNLFAYIDFHLLDIHIADLIEMIPDIDTIVPMLKTFSGKAEFHLAAQTNLKSNYDLKYSTLRGAMSISGKDLVVLDNQTFSTIAKYLRFKKQTENKVDSVSVEMTVFQREVDLYPFLISMDKYQAIVAGHYEIGKNYDCHFSLVESPLPMRLGLKVSGLPNHMKFRLETPQYAHLFKPEKRNVVENETIKLKQMITHSLRANVKE